MRLQTEHFRPVQRSLPVSTTAVPQNNTQYTRPRFPFDQSHRQPHCVAQFNRVQLTTGAGVPVTMIVANMRSLRTHKIHEGCHTYRYNLRRCVLRTIGMVEKLLRTAALAFLEVLRFCQQLGERCFGRSVWGAFIQIFQISPLVFYVSTRQHSIFLCTSHALLPSVVSATINGSRREAFEINGYDLPVSAVEEPRPTPHPAVAPQLYYLNARRRYVIISKIYGFIY